MRKFLKLIVVVLVFGATQARAAELSPKELKEAEKLYHLKCAKCHKFYDPAGYSKPEWNEWMRKMARKSKLKGKQEELLARYTELLRAPALGKPEQAQAQGVAR